MQPESLKCPKTQKIHTNGKTTQPVTKMINATEFFICEIEICAKSLHVRGKQKNKRIKRKNKTNNKNKRPQTTKMFSKIYFINQKTNKYFKMMRSSSDQKFDDNLLLQNNKFRKTRPEAALREHARRRLKHEGAPGGGSPGARPKAAPEFKAVFENVFLAFITRHGFWIKITFPSSFCMDTSISIGATTSNQEDMIYKQAKRSRRSLWPRSV